MLHDSSGALNRVLSGVLPDFKPYHSLNEESWCWCGQLCSGPLEDEAGQGAGGRVVCGGRHDGGRREGLSPSWRQAKVATSCEGEDHGSATKPLLWR